MFSNKNSKCTFIPDLLSNDFGEECDSLWHIDFLPNDITSYIHSVLLLQSEYTTRVYSLDAEVAEHLAQEVDKNKQ